MLEMRVSIVRYIGDEPQPGIVESQLEDAHGRCWSFVDKTAIFSAEILDDQSKYPQPGVIACELVGRRSDPAGREVVRVSTERPWSIESVDGATQFDVLPEQLVECGHNLNTTSESRSYASYQGTTLVEPKDSEE